MREDVLVQTMTGVVLLDADVVLLAVALVQLRFNGGAHPAARDFALSRARAIGLDDVDSESLLLTDLEYEALVLGCRARFVASRDARLALLFLADACVDVDLLPSVIRAIDSELGLLRGDDPSANVEHAESLTNFLKLFDTSRASDTLAILRSCGISEIEDAASERVQMRGSVSRVGCGR